MPNKDSKAQSPPDNHCAAIFEQSPISIQIMSPDGRIVQVNEAWEELWGMTLDQVEEYNIFTDKQLEKKGVMPYIKSAFNGQFTEIPPVLYDPNENPSDKIRPNATKRWTKAVIYPVKNSAGQLREVVLMFEDITARKQAEEKIKANELRYQSLLENTSDIIYTHDLQGNCFSINKAGEKILGYSAEELTKMNIAQVIAPEHLEMAKQMIEQKSHDPSPTVYELDVITKDGRRLTFEINTRISSIEGQPLVVEGIARNITARKQVEQALRVSEARCRSFLENANDIIYSHDLLGNYVAVNGAAEKITGYSLKELEKMNIAEFVVPEHHERIKQVIERKLHDPTPSVHEFDIITKDGRRRTLEVNPKISAIEGQPLAIEGVARDITERKQAENALRASEERFRRAIAIETVGIVFFKTDRQLGGQITDSNDAFLKMSGYDREDCEQGLLRWDKMTPPEFIPQSLKSVDEFLTFGRTAPYERQYIRKDGSRWWALFVATRISTEEGVEFIIDITERKQTEEKLRESEERFRNAFAIETVGVIFFKTDGQITDSNDAFLRMSGYDREDCQRGLLRWDEMTPPEFKPKMIKALGEFLTFGRILPYEKQCIRKNGSRWWSLIAATRINAEEGVEFIIDITERKRAEERLRESEKRLRLATEAAQMYSWELDLNTQEVKYSEYAGAAFNSDSLPKNLEEVMAKIHPEDRPQTMREVERAISGTGTFTHQYRIVNPGEQITWYESFAVTVHDIQGNSGSLIGITQDISERKQLEEIRHTWAERLEAAREAERRRLSLQLHDEIVQQLAVASIKLQRLEKKLVQLLPEENAIFSDLVMTQELLRRNQKSLRHMAHVLHSGVLEQFGLVEAFRKFTRNIDTILKEHSINFSLDLAPNFPRLEPIVEIGIYRTAQEAVVNALKHSHADLISLSLGIKDETALVVITDDGCGFDAEKAENGGIGFASMYDRAEIIGAKLDVASETGRGTKITLEVPLEKSRQKT